MFNLIVMNPLLKLTFEEQAQIGIGLPHRGYEVPLMLAGKKPCLITEWPLNYIKNGGEDYTQLTSAIESGQLVVVGTHTSFQPHHIICQAQDIEAVKAIALLAGRRVTGRQATREEFEVYERFVSTYCGIQMRDETGQFVFDNYNNRLRTQGIEDYELLLTGAIRATLPVMTGTDFNNCPSAIRDKLAKGELTAVHAVTETSMTAIIAQKEHVEMGQELFARHWHEGKGYEPLSGPDYTKRIAHLLGYTPADAEFFMTTGGKPPAEQTDEEKNIIQSFDLLRRARAQYLLGNSP